MAQGPKELKAALRRLEQRYAAKELTRLQLDEAVTALLGGDHDPDRAAEAAYEGARRVQDD